MNLPELAWRLIAPVLAAGAIEMRYYCTDVAIQSKDDQSPVTVADQEAEAILLKALAEVAPDIPVIAEEAVAAGRIPAIGNTFFLVDPLDGTKEFINRRGEFTVNVALIENRQPTLGLVYAPALDELYVTLGANEAGIARLPADATPSSLDACGFQRITTRQPDMANLTAVASRSHMTPETQDFLARYKIGKLTNSGSSLKFCAVARGEADIYPRLAPTMEWDTAAGHAVLRAAGGTTTHPDGTAMTYGRTETGFRNDSFVAWGTREPL